MNYFTKLMHYYDYLIETDRPLNREIIEKQVRLCQAEKVLRDLVRENDRLQAVLTQVDEFTYQSEENDSAKDEQISQAKIKLEQAEKDHEQSMKKFESESCEQSGLFMKIENLPIEMERKNDYIEGDLLILREELEIELRTLKQQQNIQRLDESKLFHLDSNQRNIINLLTKEIDILTN